MINILQVFAKEKYFLYSNSKNNKLLNKMCIKLNEKFKEKVSTLKFISWDLYIKDNVLYWKDNKLPKIDYIMFEWYKFPIRKPEIIEFIEKNWWKSLVSSKNIKYFKKEEQYYSLLNSNISHYYPKTSIFNFDNNTDFNLKSFSGKYPFVIKKSLWWNWTDVQLIKNEKMLVEYFNLLLSKNYSWKLLIQEPVDCIPWLDNRIYIINDKIHSWIIRDNRWNFVSNIWKWGKSILLDLKKISPKAIKAINDIKNHFSWLVYFWLDLVETKNGEYKMFEINVVWEYTNPNLIDSISTAIADSFIWK